MGQDKQKEPRRSVNLSKEVHNRLAWAAFHSERSAKDIAEEAITAWLKKFEKKRATAPTTAAAGEKDHV